MSLALGTFIGGKYLVRRALAAGGMGEVFLCEALGPQGFAKTVVVKCMHPHVAKDPTLVRMFKAEARLAARFTHPNIVQTFDFDAHADTYYLAMEFVDGHSLKEALTRASEKASLCFRPILAAHIAAQVASGLYYAHCARDNDGSPLNVVHRDVTPHNVMLSLAGDVKLTDFGIAKANLQTSLTAAGMLKGKLAYMSPEQAEGEEDVDARTDFFALGATLWEMLTGCRLFEGKTDQQLIWAVIRGRIRAPSSLYSEIPRELDAIVLQALERARARRRVDRAAVPERRGWGPAA